MNLDIENNNKKLNSSFSKELKKSIEKKSQFSIDRFEGDFAICENKETNEIINIHRSLIPENCKEGDILKLENGVYIIDKVSTNTEQNEIKSMVNNLFKKKN